MLFFLCAPAKEFVEIPSDFDSFAGGNDSTTPVTVIPTMKQMIQLQERSNKGLAREKPFPLGASHLI